MFKESTIYSSGPYKITSLSANLNLSVVTNQQDYGFSTDVDMAFAYVDTQTINFTWDVLDPVTNKSANINDGIFNYVTYYYYKNPTLGDKIPTLTDADLNDFKAFLKREKIAFDTETEVALKSTLEKAKKENVDAAIATEYQQLLSALEKSEETLIDKNQKEIKNLILDEIIKRYQYKEGLYQYYIKSNFEIKKSIEVLNDKSQYNSILKI